MRKALSINNETSPLRLVGLSAFPQILSFCTGGAGEHLQLPALIPQMTAAWLGDRLQVLRDEVMAQSFSSLGMSCLETHECIRAGTGSESWVGMGQRGESWWQCANAIC